MITRKQFLKLGAMSAGAVALLSSVGFLAGQVKQGQTGMMGIIRIRPVPGKKYSPSFLRFCERAKFTSTKEAIQRARNRGVEYLLVAEQG